VIIPSSANATQVLNKLKEKKLIRRVWKAKLAMRLLGADRHIHAGSYYLRPDMSLWEIFRTIQHQGKKENNIFTKVVIPEGLTLPEIAELFDKADIIEKKEFLFGAEHLSLFPELKKRHPFLRQQSLTSLEGYLFPDTYILSPGTPAVQLYEIMLARFESVLVPIYEQHQQPAMNLHQLLTLASIIEKETPRKEERAIVASVYRNRLSKGMLLESCPTVKYAMGDPQKPELYFKDLNVASPYNTYRHGGLPPGPICNPGKASFEAAVSPATTHYLFFVAKGDGSNLFSRTNEEHVRKTHQVRPPKSP
jgi:UPF0755 protein